MIDLTAVPSGATPSPLGATSPAAFTVATFDLLAQLHAEPTRKFYLAHKAEFQQLVEGPLQNLLLEVKKKLPSSITSVMETESKLFGRIMKNDYGLGNAWDFYWGAFYPKGGNRIQDAQLFLWLNHEGLDFGFSIGQYASTSSKLFLSNCNTYADTLLRVLTPRLAGAAIVYGERHDENDGRTFQKPTASSVSLEQWLKDPKSAGVSAATVLSKKKVLALTLEELTNDIASTFQLLFPLVLMTTSDAPLKPIGDYLGQDILDPTPVVLPPPVIDDPSKDVKPLVVFTINAEYTLAQCAEETGFEESLLKRWVSAIERKGQAILYGPPGTGKTYVASHLARHLIGGADGFTEMVQFHPAYAYEDFIQGIRPVTRTDGSLAYRIVSGRFLDFCEKAAARKGTCVLIIDEINRANLARVFGELMYLLEYRTSEVPLAGGGKLFIPANVRIIGTMNTADRSIALVDHALRRRFAFLALHPDYEILKRFHQKTGFSTGGLIEVLRQVNSAIGDAHYEVGISFFMRDHLALDLEEIWCMEIEPYLEEYFLDQPQRLDPFRWKNISNKVL